MNPANYGTTLYRVVITVLVIFREGNVTIRVRTKKYRVHVVRATVPPLVVANLMVLMSPIPLTIPLLRNTRPLEKPSTYPEAEG